MIQIEQTPNPDSLKFISEKIISAVGTEEFQRNKLHKVSNVFIKKLLGFDNKYDKQVTTLVKKKIQFEQSLRISNWDTPSDTLTATSPEIHVNLKRRLSVRECAILQTFPDDFVFEGATFRSMHKQIGNAVPVLLAEKVAKEIKKMIESKSLRRAA